MPSGGARLGAGRPQDPNAFRTDRRKDLSGLTMLPAEGREGDPPAWPLLSASRPETDEREAEMWSRVWRKPQAIIWERDHLVEVVALFVRQFVEGEASGNSAENRKAIQSYFGALFLTPHSLKSGGYAIADAVEVAKTPAKRARSTARSRLKVVPNVGGS